MAITSGVLLFFILFTYATVISVLYWNDYVNRPLILKQKEETLRMREIELERRDSMVVDKELCFRELTKLKTVQHTALDVLKSYTIHHDTNNMDRDRQQTVQTVPTRVKSEEMQFI